MVVSANGAAIVPVGSRAAERFDPRVLVWRNSLRGDLPADPVGFFGQDDPLSVSECGKRGGDAAKPAANNRHVTSELARPCRLIRQREERSRSSKEIPPAGVQSMHSPNGDGCDSRPRSTFNLEGLNDEGKRVDAGGRKRAE